LLLYGATTGLTLLHFASGTTELCKAMHAARSAIAQGQDALDAAQLTLFNSAVRLQLQNTLQLGAGLFQVPGVQQPSRQTEVSSGIGQSAVDVAPHHFAGIFASLGIPPNTEIRNHLNQPRELAKGKPITALFG
jgi:hypothetical protein